MKKYFTKYLRTEEERKDWKEWDVLVHEETDMLAHYHPTLDVTGKTYDGYNKVRLFLCSHEVDLEDWAKIRENPIYMAHTPKDKYEALPFKKIGEISASWVKANMEFHENEVRIMKCADKYSSKILCELEGKEWPHEKDIIITPGEVHHVEVKCPHCEHFS